jgi:putative spermidine/putrescine transport system substrate-binding protein
MTLESALLADGVKVEDVYKVLATPEGVDRAFAKLDQIKPQIIWWSSGAESIERLVAGDVAVTTTFNGRVTAANAAGKQLALEWDGQIYGIDFWGIVMGSPRKETAEKFIQFASDPEVQRKFPEFISYGVLNKKAIALVDAKYLNAIPTTPEHLANAMALDVQFWADNGESLEERFKAWQAQ